MEVKFANTLVYVDNEFIAKVTSFKTTISIAEENITGAEDFVPGTDLLSEQYTCISKGQTAEVEGISQESSLTGPDDGQSEMRDAIESGATVTVRHTKNTGYGYNLTGFFTNYEENGSTGEVYKWKGTFRVNSKTEIVPGS